MKVVTGEQMREIEQFAIKEIGIPSIILMENAALSLLKHCLDAVKNIENPKILIICGPGNNGGDGMALAFHLHNHGIKAQVIYAGDINAVKGDPAVYLGIIKKLENGSHAAFRQLPFRQPDSHETIASADIVVDALLGTGLSRNVDGNYREIIEMINKYAKYVISADIPSGVHAGTGQILGCAVKADETLTFAYPKTGVLVYPGAEYSGKVHVGDISLPPELIGRFEIKAHMLTDSEAKDLLPVRGQRTNKGSYGRILIFAGSNEMPGAAALASSAAYMTGGGLVCACVLQNVANVIHNWQREVVTRIVPDKNGFYCKESLKAAADEINQADVIVAGPGIGRNAGVTEFVRELINISKAPLILDADALFAVSQDVSILKTLKTQCVITPHPGEMSRLVSKTVPEILDNMIETAVNFSKEFNVVTLLKDAHTIIAMPDGNYYINTTGNNSLSKAGTGDVLSGMIAGFTAQALHGSALHGSALHGSGVFTAGVLSAYIHGKAGEAASLCKSNYGVSASDIIEQIPLVIGKIWQPCCL